MIYLYIFLVLLTGGFSYQFLSSIAYHAHLSVTNKNCGSKNIKTISGDDFLSLFRSIDIDWEIHEKYKNSIFAPMSDQLTVYHMIHVNGVFKLNNTFYLFDCAKSYRQVVKSLKKDITIIQAKAYLTK